MNIDDIQVQPKWVRSRKTRSQTSTSRNEPLLCWLGERSPPNRRRCRGHFRRRAQAATARLGRAKAPEVRRRTRGAFKNAGKAA